MAAVEASKKKCEFWDKCYRKNKKHREEFSHPGDDDDKATAPSKTVSFIFYSYAVLF